MPVRTTQSQNPMMLLFGCTGAITPNATSYLVPGNGVAHAAEIQLRVPRDGIIGVLYVAQRVASGAGGRTDIYTVRVNGANTDITCTLDNATEGEDGSTYIPHIWTVYEGDKISIQLISNDAGDTSEDVVATLLYFPSGIT